MKQKGNDFEIVYEKSGKYDKYTYRNKNDSNEKYITIGTDAAGA